MQMPNSEVVKAGRVLRTLILTRSPGLVRDRRQNSRTFRRCLVGAEMVCNNQFMIICFIY